MRAMALQRARAAQRIETLQVRLDGLDPQHVLARGYAWLADERGAVVNSVRQLQPGQAVQATLADGAAALAVMRIDPAEGA